MPLGERERLNWCQLEKISLFELLVVKITIRHIHSKMCKASGTERNANVGKSTNEHKNESSARAGGKREAFPSLDESFSERRFVHYK